jgi:hypothetical protein
MKDKKIRQIISRAARDMSGISQRADEYMTRATKKGAHIQYGRSNGDSSAASPERRRQKD